jgi:hypothetical protein
MNDLQWQTVMQSGIAALALIGYHTDGVSGAIAMLLIAFGSGLFVASTTNTDVQQ